ncbi:hypothetical protein BV22DRAFT_1135232 [Leucogyrophana mollusca]|uniref:Uncharacterized protein n=1 Tax=Leucogyrophana mollusca TaxID=85980 RepID=A0ACB8AYJ2_9AGAM|nr:hypothetical protein BV22DRAFT_1135232 [Leucogyrophana mollusca]
MTDYNSASLPLRFKSLDLSDGKSLMRGSFTITLQVSFEYEQCCNVANSLPTFHTSLGTSHPVQGSGELAAVDSIKRLFEDQFIVALRERWYSGWWNKVELPLSMQPPLSDSGYFFPNPLPSTLPSRSSFIIPSPDSALSLRSSALQSNAWDAETENGAWSPSNTINLYPSSCASSPESNRSSLHTLSDTSLSPMLRASSDVWHGADYGWTAHADPVHPLLSENITYRSTKARQGAPRVTAPHLASPQTRSRTPTDTPLYPALPADLVTPVTLLQCTPLVSTASTDTQTPSLLSVATSPRQLKKGAAGTTRTAQPLPTKTCTANVPTRTLVESTPAVDTNTNFSRLVFPNAQPASPSPAHSRIAPHTPLPAEIRKVRSQGHRKPNTTPGLPQARQAPLVPRQRGREQPPVQIQTAMHAHEGNVSVTNHIYLMTSNLPEGRDNISYDAHSLSEIRYLLLDLPLHAMTWDEIHRCINGHYQRWRWTAILIKCGIPEHRVPALLSVMETISQAQSNRALHLRIANVNSTKSRI